ncbi:pyridoxal-phosphate dependent enzyme [Lacipirellula parvula]|uniref:Tryptophan synthase beta chain-like PALP domain-containing protein n=1 Tax=Lacipirellula parvula TaxID=2650471 RepID=A0A5K7X8F3_9BACT|nr:pyridoxal-phosphate dependent enzyme [Lacipirellula parvula]BBO31041.1 hypothetical protein PLANPX_0653 [Lacipirellula parvula]
MSRLTAIRLFQRTGRAPSKQPGWATLCKYRARSMSNASPVIDVPELAAIIGADAVYLKFEGVHPTGTHKHRAARSVIRHAVRSQFAVVTVGSCGNYGAAIAFEAAASRASCHVFVPSNYARSRTAEMLEYGAEVHFVEGTYEDAVASSREFAVQSGAYDCNASGFADDLILRSYRAIAAELHEQVHGITAVWVPVGDGTTITGIYEGFRAKNKVARMYAVSSAGNNAACASVAAGMVVELQPADICPTSFNEPLISWRSAHAEDVVRLVRESGGGAIEVTDAQLSDAASQLSSFAAINSWPAGAAGLAGLIAAPAHLRTGRHAIVVTAAKNESP